MSQESSAGRLIVKEAAVAKTASYVVETMSSAAAANRFHLPAIGAGIGERSRPKITVELSGDVAGISVDISLPYPAPLRAAAAEVRNLVSHQVERLTGIPVAWVDIRVVSLDSGSPERSLL